MSKFSETPVGKAFAANAELQELIKKYNEQEKVYKRFLKKLSYYTVEYDRQKRYLNHLAGKINDLKHKIQYK